MKIERAIEQSDTSKANDFYPKIVVDHKKRQVRSIETGAVTLNTGESFFLEPPDDKFGITYTQLITYTTDGTYVVKTAPKTRYGFVGDESGNIHRFSLADGSVNSASPWPMSIGSYVNDLISETVYLYASYNDSSGNHYISKYTTGGNPLWTTTVPSSTPIAIAVGTTYLYATMMDGTAHRYNKTTGAEDTTGNWPITFASSTSINHFNMKVDSADNVYIVDTYNWNVLQYDSAGNQTWTYATPSKQPKSIALFKAWLIIGYGDNTVDIVDTSTGNSIATSAYSTGSEIEVLANNDSYVAIGTWAFPMALATPNGAQTLIITNNNAPSVNMIVPGATTTGEVWVQQSIFQNTTVNSLSIDDNNDVYVGTYYGNLYKLSSVDGSLLWNHPMPTYNNPWRMCLAYV